MKSLTDIIVENYAHINFKPPKGVKTACKRGLELKADYGGAGLTSAAVSWASKLSKGSPISPEKVRKMHAYFARHEVDRKKDWDDPPTPGYVAWMLWGGNSGRSWSAKIVKQLDAADKRKPRRDETKKPKKKGLVGAGGAWKTAKRQAKKQGKGNNEKYIGAIYKSMTGGK